ncbi:hypothetical protein BGZ80_009230 [Entomortierella chlamydospora]|uniref:sphingomyelin phosphodiesterase n=1 Tax=Entomortierella chlamydospora TaxID=101097 RepID=A0A9P6MXJ4_9FUNG|nr:hypothetical protein BGZ79_004350 [Entomortierella chlamydospora]KAG0016437.1 hypothetical protein BGZ80_009230 [Entomortierella chlamydospora]
MKISTSLLPLALAAVATVPSFTAAKNVTLSVLTNNLYLMSKILYPNWGQDTRAQLIANSDYIKYHDVIVFEECWDSSPCGILRNGLQSQYPYQTPTVGSTKSGWDSTSGSYSSMIPENGGVVIMSKWPITQKRQFIYKDACGADWFSLKGFAYVEINYQGTNIHVFGTHTQSDDSACTSGQAAGDRASQLSSMRSYIDSLNIPSDELVIMAGDFNIDRNSAEYASTLTRLSANQAGTFDGFAYTWDPDTNEIAHYNYPNDPSQYIDFVFTDKKHKAVNSMVQTSLYVKSPEYTIQSVAYHEYSDHYPVQSIIEVDL